MASLIRLTSRIVYRAPYICNHNTSQINCHFNQIRHAGHAKWQNIRGTKQANDLAKGKLISRYVQLIRRAIISNNRQTDPKLNPKLAELLAEAGRLNVPKATMERAIVRAADLKVKSVNVEIQGPAGCTLIARCETENTGQLRRDIKKVIKKFDSNVLPDDTVINMFQSRGFIRTDDKTIDGRDINQDFAEEAAIMSNAQEVSEEAPVEESTTGKKIWVFETDAETLNPCKGELEKHGFKVLSYDLELVAYRDVDFGPGVFDQVVEITKALQELDQVIDVFHNVAPPAG